MIYINVMKLLYLIMFIILLQHSQQEYLDRKVVVSKGIQLSGSKVRGRNNNLQSYHLKNVEEFRGLRGVFCK